MYYSGVSSTDPRFEHYSWTCVWCRDLFINKSSSELYSTILICLKKKNWWWPLPAKICFIVKIYHLIQCTESCFWLRTHSTKLEFRQREMQPIVKYVPISRGEVSYVLTQILDFVSVCNQKLRSEVRWNVAAWRDVTSLTIPVPCSSILNFDRFCARL